MGRVVLEDGEYVIFFDLILHYMIPSANVAL